jgi:hypothetical protein
MRTTIELDDELFGELKQEAARNRKTLREVVNDYLRKGMASPKTHKKYVFRWKASPRGRIMPGVRINDRKSLYDLMDGIE